MQPMLVAAVTTHMAPRWGPQPLKEFEAMPPHQQQLWRKVPKTTDDSEVVAEGSNGFALH